MKKFFYALILIFLFLSGTMASVQTFGNFSVEVPDGWEGRLQDETLILGHETKKASIIVAFNKIDEAELTDIVEYLYSEMDGRDLEQDDDGDYNFNFVNASGDESIALITSDEEQEYYVAVFMTGFDDDDLQNDFEKILASINF